MLKRILSFFRRGAAAVMGNWALDAARQETAQSMPALCMLALEIDHMTGKQCRELVK